jgi:hypothetical protein
VLEALFEVTSGIEWRSKNGWVTAAPLSEWVGIAVDDKGRVIELGLPMNNLKGVL